jgi:hypothetical protein
VELLPQARSWELPKRVISHAPLVVMMMVVVVDQEIQEYDFKQFHYLNIIYMNIRTIILYLY